MTRRVLFAILAVLGGAGAFLTGAEKRPEPRYEGKPLSYWVGRLQKCERDDDRQRVAEAIKAFGPDAAPAVPALLAMLDDRSKDFRTLIASILCEVGPGAKSAVPDLVRSLEKKTARSPALVIRILGRIGPEAKEALPALLEALKDRSLQDEAVGALCSVRPPAGIAIPALRKAIRDAKAHERERLYAAFSLLEPLPKLGSAAVPLLLEFLTEEEAEWKCWSARSLAKIGAEAKDAVSALTKLLSHANPDVRLDAASALWRIQKDPAVVPVLAALLQEKARYLAEPAAEILGEMGTSARSAIPALERARSHEIDAVRLAAEVTLARIRSQQGPAPSRP